MVLLDVNNLSVFFHREDGSAFEAVKKVNFTVDNGEVVGIVGESGSGKSVTALSILGLLPYPKAFLASDSSIQFEGKELIEAKGKELQRVRGNDIAFIFQEPMSSLNPLHRIGKQISETLCLHKKITPKKAEKEVIRLLKLTGISNTERRKDAYPFELSGGQRQRVMIAMAIANNPKLLIADEPTTALDVTIQEQIIDLLMELKHKLKMSILFISHDLKLVSKIADRVCVMKGGEIVEQGAVKDIFEHPQNEYTKLLVSSSMIKNPAKTICNKELLAVKNVTVTFPLKKNFWGGITETIQAVDKVSFSIKQGETLGIVGESGSGKTTLGMAISGLVPLPDGEIYFKNILVNQLDGKRKLKLKQKMQVVFQDPYNSLNPRMTIEEIVGEGLKVHCRELSKIERKHLVIEALNDVGLQSDVLDRYPHEFSGGQRQRIAIARALILKPELLILDEPTSALDVTIQAQIIDLLQKIQKERQISYIFISHDMKAVQAMADRIAVMKDGKIIELDTAAHIFEQPQQDYTKLLINASL